VAERNIQAILYEKGGLPLWIRRYARIDTCIPRAVQMMLLDGKVGQVIEVSHSVTGMQIGTVKMTATGRLITEWIWGV
jgi:hypothetical protein